MNWLIYSAGRAKSKLTLTISSQQKIAQNELSVEEKPVVLLQGNIHTHHYLFFSRVKTKSNYSFHFGSTEDPILGL